MENSIAVIGMAGRFPGAKNIDEFWDNIKNKVESIVLFSDEELIRSGVNPSLLKDKNYIKAKGYLKDAALFDAEFFKFSSYEAEVLDPQFRLFFEVAWEALENASYVPGKSEDRVGVFAGSSSSNYIDNILNSTKKLPKSQAQDLAFLTYNAKDYLTTLLAYKLNLTGPCINVQTACSTSLVAICMACESLLASSCDVALAGGVSVTTPLKSGYLFQPGMILSSNGHCSAFDARACGTVPGSGLGLIVLKRLDKALNDHDHIHAIIKGFAVNNDGAGKVGFAAPSVEGQSKAIQFALDHAKIKPEMISYIETHGTGTLLGDPIEIKALEKVFSSSFSKEPCIALGALKPNIGHLDVAAGVAGVIKTVQALKHKCLPPNINFENINPSISLSNSGFYINTATKAWYNQRMPRFAGVSSFGIGGTNAHVVLQESPGPSISKDSRFPILLVLSAQKRSALIRKRRAIAKYLQSYPEISLNDVAYTLQVGRKAMEDRFACICTSRDQAIKRLSDLNQLEILEYDMDEVDIASKSYRDELCFMARNWLDKHAINWEKLYLSERPFKIPLPTYPFESREYWVDCNVQSHASTIQEVSAKKKLRFSKKESELVIISIFKSFLGGDNINTTDDFYRLGGDSLLALQLIEEIRKRLNVMIPIEKFENFSTPNDLVNFIFNKHNGED